MSAPEPLYRLMGINSLNLSKNETILLEADLFTRICDEVKDFYREQYKDYFNLIKFDKEMETTTMLDGKFANLIINDILTTKEYDITGIAYYTDTYEDVVNEIVTGNNARPSALFLRKLIELHRIVRKDIYNNVIKKIAEQYLRICAA